MANQEHFEILKQGWEVWNEWRRANGGIKPDLSGICFDERIKVPNVLSMLVALLYNKQKARSIDLSETNLDNSKINSNLIGADFGQSSLIGVDFRGSTLNFTNFECADLSNAILSNVPSIEVNFKEVNFTTATLLQTNFEGSDLTKANFFNANLTGANLSRTRLLKTNFEKANLTDAKIYGISAWDINTSETIQTNLVITPDDSPAITVDNLEVAQFVYLLLNNQKIRDVIDTLGQKAVLILGRFSEGRKEVLDAIAESLRQRGFLPIIFDFDKSQERDFTETIMTLAGLSLFVIVDITNPRSSPLELHATVPNYKIPFVPIMQSGETPFSMFRDLQIYPWVLPIVEYPNQKTLIKRLNSSVIKPALRKHKELIKIKAKNVLINILRK